MQAAKRRSKATKAWQKLKTIASCMLRTLRRDPSILVARLLLRPTFEETRDYWVVLYFLLKQLPSTFAHQKAQLDCKRQKVQPDEVIRLLEWNSSALQEFEDVVVCSDTIAEDADFSSVRMTSFPAITDLAKHKQHLCLIKDNWLLDWGWGFSSSIYTAMQDACAVTSNQQGPLLCN